MRRFVTSASGAGPHEAIVAGIEIAESGDTPSFDNSAIGLPNDNA
jgi:hypothetical protein